MASRYLTRKETPQQKREEPTYKASFSILLYLLGREALDHLPHYITFDAFGILYLDIWRVIGAGLRCWLLLNIRKYPDHEELIRVGYDLFF